MKQITFLIFFIFSNICLAETQDDLVETIKVRCNWLNEQIPFDIREDCMLDYVNCGVGSGGKIDMKDLDKCVDKKREKSDE